MKKLMYIVSFNYFDSRGNQKQKRVTCKTLEGLKKELDKHEIYCINAVSKNIANIDLGIKTYI